LLYLVAASVRPSALASIRQVVGLGPGQVGRPWRHCRRRRL